MRVGVLYGGISSERDVSLKTGAGVLKAFQELGQDVVGIDWKPGSDPAELIKAAKVDVIWNALHGTYGEDGAIQGLLTCLKIPFTGSGILASALAMDKIASKRLYETMKIPTPPWRELHSPSELPDAVARFGLPLVVKPSREGSSVGVAILRDKADFGKGWDEASSHSGPVLCEKYISGTELHIGILDGEVLGTIEVRPASGFYDYEAKYLRNDTQYLIPPPDLSPSVIARAEEWALAAYRATGCAGHSRVDLRVAQNGDPYVLEVNTLPGMTATSLLPKIAAHANMTYAALCEKILIAALPKAT